MKTAVIFVSTHHGNTKRIAKEIANALGAKLLEPNEVNEEALSGFDLLGFGSGIYYSKHHKSLLNLIDTLPAMKDKKPFIFSTAGVNDRLVEKNLAKNHEAMRSKLAEKGFDVVDEFSCCGFMTWWYYKLLGGRNKGRPNQDDLEKARNFALNLKQKAQVISLRFPSEQE
jgi:flavodoxin